MVQKRESRHTGPGSELFDGVFSSPQKILRVIRASQQPLKPHEGVTPLVAHFHGPILVSVADTSSSGPANGCGVNKLF